MFRYEIQFLGRTPDDYERHMRAVTAAPITGKMGFKSYFFAGVKGLVVLLENEADCHAVQRAVPRIDVVGTWEIPVAPARVERPAPRRLAA